MHKKIFLDAIAPIPDKKPTQALIIFYDQLNLAVFPPELLAQKPLLIFVESFAYATNIPHHKQKLVYILSAQRHFAIECHQQGFPVLPLFTSGDHSVAIAEFLTQNPEVTLTYMMPSEWDIRTKMAELAGQFMEKFTDKFTEKNKIQAIANNFFIADTAKFLPKIKKNYRLETFYRDLRQSTGYLMDGKKPAGGKWNYDKENRKSLPAKTKIPKAPELIPDAITQEVMALVETFLPDNFGTISGFNYAVTRMQALDFAQKFIQERLPNFGAYEDAIKVGEPFLFHSVLSIHLNNGLLLPQELCEMAIAAYLQGKSPLNSVEGFVRQILGWREFIHIYYEAMMPAVKNLNHFGFSHNLPQLYWDANTEMLCLKDAVSNVINHAYSHHIQRLMVLSNFSNLTFTNPHALNRWFYLAYIDAYEWVELPNVLGMSTFADGGILASKPYVSGGNYINKMSNCCAGCKFDVKQKTGAEACPFNYLYWNFVETHQQDFMENGRVSLMTKMFDAKPESEKAEIRASAQTFIANLQRDQT